MDIFKNCRSLFCQLGLLVAASLLCTTANAQSNDESGADRPKSLDEITVTARKREEGLQDIPTSAAALTRDFLNALNPVEDIRELTDLIPGITMNDVNLYFVSEPSIRGGGAGRNRYSASATGLYRNGSYVASGGPGGKNFLRMDYFDMERAEVLRGPQGALYGRNALGGSINLISRKPQEEFGVDLTLRAGELDLRAAELTVNVPVNEQFAIRASYVDETRDEGFYTDVNGDFVDTQDFEHARFSMRYQPTESIDIVYSWDKQEQSMTPTIRISQSAVDQMGSPFKTLINTPHQDSLDGEMHSLVADVEMGGGVMTFVVNHRDRRYIAGQDADFWIASRETQQRRFAQSGGGVSKFAELRFASGGLENFTWLLGADYFTYENNDWTDLTVNYPIDTPANLWYRQIDYGMDNWSVFGMLEYTFDSVPITLAAEARYAYDEFNGYFNQTRFNKDPVEVLRDFTANDDWQNVPMALTASYRLEKLDAITYVKAASSYRTGGMNDGVGSPYALYPSQLSYDEESNITYELGWKQTALDGRMTFNFAGYLGEYQDFIAGTNNGCTLSEDINPCQLLDEFGNPLGFNPDGTRVGAAPITTEPIPPNQSILITSFMGNVGDVSMWGYEAELGYLAPLDSGGSIRFNLAYSKQHGTVDDLNEDVAEALKVKADGASLIYTVPDQWKSQIIFSKDIGNAASDSFFSGATFVMSANYVYESGGFWDLDIAAPNPMSNVKRLNARIGLQADKWSFMINGQNITNEDYHTFHNSTVSYWRQINPRFYSAQFKYHFGD